MKSQTKERFNLQRLRSFLFDARGPSGHSWFRKARFAMSLYSPFGMMAVVGVAKDIYLEKFGLEPTSFSILVTIASFWAPLQDMLVGRLQDKEVLSRFFPVERWGRRAPWLLTHSILATLGASVMYLPPEGHAAYAWFLVVWILTSWGISGCIISFEAARQQVYPFKEERIGVEGLCKYACMAGGGSGGLVFLVLSKDASLAVRLAFVLYIIPVGLLSLEAVPLFQQARHDQAVHGSEETGLLNVLWEALPLWIRQCLRKGETSRNGALQHLLALKFWNGSYGVCISTMLLYYVTYVLKLSSWERIQVIMGAGAAAGTTEAVMNLVYVHLFTRNDSLRDKAGKNDKMLLYLVVTLRVVNALLTFLLIGFLQPSVFLMFVWCIVTRVGLCSFSFWRVSAVCWLVDEDCLSAASAKDRTRRNMREGQIFGALSMSQILAAAIFSSLTFLGLGLAGFQTKNCEASCAQLGLPGDSECTDQCFREVIDMQPESLRLYVRFIIGIFAPICELLIAFHAFQFPIKNARLRKLYLSKAMDRGEEVSEAVASEPYQAKSQIVLMDEEDDDGGFSTHRFIERLVHTVRSISVGRSLTVRFAGSAASKLEVKEDTSELSTAASTRYSL